MLSPKMMRIGIEVRFTNFSVATTRGASMGRALVVGGYLVGRPSAGKANSPGSNAMMAVRVPRPDRRDPAVLTAVGVDGHRAGTHLTNELRDGASAKFGVLCVGEGLRSGVRRLLAQESLHGPSVPA